jgi:hypothetical protein
VKLASDGTSRFATKKGFQTCPSTSRDEFAAMAVAAVLTGPTAEGDEEREPARKLARRDRGNPCKPGESNEGVRGTGANSFAGSTGWGSLVRAPSAHHQGPSLGHPRLFSAAFPRSPERAWLCTMRQLSQLGVSRSVPPIHNLLRAEVFFSSLRLGSREPVAVPSLYVGLMFGLHYAGIPLGEHH